MQLTPDEPANFEIDAVRCNFGTLTTRRMVDITAWLNDDQLDAIVEKIMEDSK